MGVERRPRKRKLTPVEVSIERDRAARHKRAAAADVQAQLREQFLAAEKARRASPD